MGGLLAACFTEKYPDLVKRLILFAPPGYPLSGAKLTLAFAKSSFGGFVWRRLISPYMASEKGLQFNIKMAFHDPKGHPQETTELKELTRKMWSHHHPSYYMEIMLRTIRDFDMLHQEHVYRAIGKHPRPVLLIWGTADKSVAYQCAKRMVADLPQVEFRAIEKAGHIAILEYASLVNNWVLEFLKR
mmetsp:Transcript_33647/g.54533  ORF Transcript_33647/g.54533 Transcript_33647/m.54533 type:complete len:187 (-) Transcript_33647:59-619(-)